MDNVTLRERAVLILLLLAMQALLIVNPGYFSHDELQWGAFASARNWQDLPWVSWVDWQTFQFRPLTFNLWLLLSYGLFDRPNLFHAVFVALGSANAVGLYALLRRLDIAPRLAGMAAMVFTLGPYAAYVHGWVGTMADLLWVGLGIALSHVVLSSIRQELSRPAVFFAALLLTALALLAKEAALSISALLALAWWLSGRMQAIGWACAGSAAAATAYLAVRLPVLLWHPRESGSYEISLLQAPQRLIEYYLFIALPSKFEAANTLTGSLTLPLVVATLWIIVLLPMARTARTSALILTIGGALALAPVLPLTFSANHYGYGFAAVLAVGGALAWPKVGRPARIAMTLLCLLSVLHGVNVQRQMLRVGVIQAIYLPELAEAVAASNGVVRLRVPERNDWVFRRLSHDIPSYRGVEIGSRAQLVEGGEAADYQILEDGRLYPAH